MTHEFDSADLFGATGYDVLGMIVQKIQAGVIEIMPPPDIGKETQKGVAFRYTTMDDKEGYLILVDHDTQFKFLASLINAMMLQDIGAMTGVELDKLRDILRDGNGFV
jgi:hypothetical protein